MRFVIALVVVLVFGLLAGRALDFERSSHGVSSQTFDQVYGQMAGDDQRQEELLTELDARVRVLEADVCSFQFFEDYSFVPQRDDARRFACVKRAQP
jgi:hypothetical protein